MRRNRPIHTLAILAAVAAIQTARPRAAGDSTYLTPPKAIVDILEASPTPTLLVSPTRDRIALLERNSMPSIADVSRPMLRLAGLRIDSRTNGLHQPGGTIAITFKDVSNGLERRIVPRSGARIQGAAFSPDGRQFAFTVAHDRGIELWVADPATGQARAVTSSPLNAVTGRPFQWMPDSQTLVCQLVPDARGPAPEAAAVPRGPNIQENAGRTVPARTYEDLLETAHDEDLFEHYATAQLALVTAATGSTKAIGKPGIFVTIEPSPGGEFLLVALAKRPFSRLIPLNGFPKDVEVWNQQGRALQRIADLPASEAVPILGVPTGPRAYQWKPTEPSTLLWVEALDEGDLRKTVAHRDKLVRLSAPFTDDAKELTRTQHRFSSMSWTEKGVGLLTESERDRRRVVTWIVDGATPPRKLWDRGQQDRYGDPGTPVTRLVNGKAVVIQRDNAIYLSGAGASPAGERPFLDRLDLNSGSSQRLFQADGKSYETVVSLLADDGSSVLTRYETPEEPPNFFVREIGTGTRRPLTSFKDPAPQLRGISKQLVTYQRKDGVKLSGTLYLPPGYGQGQLLPMVMWAYPQEFVDPDTASQVVGSPNRFTSISGASHLLLLTQGYAVFDNPTMPIVGPGETANDTYVEQLVASAEAAVNKVVDMGVASRDRIGIGGHSYGAFMTANLLAHSDLFRAGIARSGAYNRTLTPFGFQSERRTFWEAPQIYSRMSPFFYANRIDEPILLIHGEADDNSGTFPIQSERFFMALQGHGATVRYVTLPNEAHGYAGRESVLHTMAEMLNWMDKHVKNAAPRKAGATAAR